MRRRPTRAARLARQAGGGALRGGPGCARAQTAAFLSALAARDWQVGSFMLGASVARCGYFDAS
jgi:hypothetical protein